MPPVARVDHAQISAANTNRDGTGTLATIATASANNSLFVSSVKVIATGNTSAGMIRLFIYDGTNTRLLDEAVVAAVTVGADVACWKTTFSTLLYLKPGWSLKASTHIGETFNAHATVTEA